MVCVDACMKASRDVPKLRMAISPMLSMLAADDTMQKVFIMQRPNRAITNRGASNELSS